MLEPLFKLVQAKAQFIILDNPAIPDQDNNHAVGLAADGIFNGLQQEITAGGINEVLKLFAGITPKDSPYSIIERISRQYGQQLIQKFEMEPDQANQLAHALIPAVVEALVEKVTHPTDTEFEINRIISLLTGGQSSQGSPVTFPGLATAYGEGIDFNLILHEMRANPTSDIGLSRLLINNLSVWMGKNARAEVSIPPIAPEVNAF